MASPILLILGAGPNIGAHVAKAFVAKGYQIALASRKPLSIDGTSSIHIPVDLNKPDTIPGVFETVKEKLGGSPSVIVYNGAYRPIDNGSDPLGSFSLENYQTSLHVNNTSVLFALQEAIRGFRSLADSASKTFIFTGNILNLKTIPAMLTFGLAKTATAYAIRAVVEGKTYESEGISFYYADERKDSGAPVGEAIDGPAAAEEYLKLAERNDQGPWLYSFVKGAGYKDFEAGQ